MRKMLVISQGWNGPFEFIYQYLHSLSYKAPAYVCSAQ